MSALRTCIDLESGEPDPIRSNVEFYPMLACGDWQGLNGRDAIEIRDPESDFPVAVVPRATGGDAMVALDYGSHAAVEMRNLPAHRRRDILSLAASLVEKDAEAFATIIATEGIKTVREARAEVSRAIGTLRLCAEEATRIVGETISFDQRPGSEQRIGHFTRTPVGLVVAITSYNDPLNLVAHKLGPSLAAGNAVILKPDQRTPLSALRLAKAFVEAGAPVGSVQVLTGFGEELAPALLTDNRVRVVSFTGGVNTAKKIARVTGLKRLELELGGNCPAIVLADADLDRAAAAITSGAYWAAGQNCLHVQRVIADAEVYAELRERLIALANAYHLGPKLDEATDMGCMIDQSAATSVVDQIKNALSRGARLLAGGNNERTRIEPTLMENVPAEHSLVREEIFGPVTVLTKACDFDDALKKANDSDYGLHAAVFTQDVNRAHHAIRELEFGAVMINDSTDYRLDAMPFGGVKSSGIGREGVRSSIGAMTESKVACFNLAS